MADGIHIRADRKTAKNSEGNFFISLFIRKPSFIRLFVTVQNSYDCFSITMFFLLSIAPLTPVSIFQTVLLEFWFIFKFSFYRKSAILSVSDWYSGFFQEVAYGENSCDRNTGF